MNNLRIIGTKKNNLRIMNINLSVCYSTQTSAHYIACKELTLPKAVDLGLNLKVQGCSEVMAINFCLVCTLFST